MMKTNDIIIFKINTNSHELSRWGCARKLPVIQGESNDASCKVFRYLSFNCIGSAIFDVIDFILQVNLS